MRIHHLFRRSVLVYYQTHGTGKHLRFCKMETMRNQQRTRDLVHEMTVWVKSLWISLLNEDNLQDVKRVILASYICFTQQFFGWKFRIVCLNGHVHFWWTCACLVIVFCWQHTLKFLRLSTSLLYCLHTEGLLANFFILSS